MNFKHAFLLAQREFSHHLSSYVGVPPLWLSSYVGVPPLRSSSYVGVPPLRSSSYVGVPPLRPSSSVGVLHLRPSSFVGGLDVSYIVPCRAHSWALTECAREPQRLCQPHYVRGVVCYATLAITIVILGLLLRLLFHSGSFLCIFGNSLAIGDWHPYLISEEKNTFNICVQCNTKIVKSLVARNSTSHTSVNWLKCYIFCRTKVFQRI